MTELSDALTRRDALAFQLREADPEPYDGEHHGMYYRIFANALLEIQKETSR